MGVKEDLGLKGVWRQVGNCFVAMENLEAGRTWARSTVRTQKLATPTTWPITKRSCLCFGDYIVEGKVPLC